MTHPTLPELMSKKEDLLEELEMYRTEGELFDMVRHPLVFSVPYDPQMNALINNLLSDNCYWELLGEVWINSENIWQNKAGWKELLSSKRPGKEYFMDEADRKAFKKLPDVITCYRGYTPGKNMAGLSYSLSKERAEWFANRLNKNKTGKVLTVKVPKIEGIRFYEYP